MFPLVGHTQPSKSSREAWEYIRELDEVENWVERNRVVPKSDHLLYTKCAQVRRGRVGDTASPCDLVCQ